MIRKLEWDAGYLKACDNRHCSRHGSYASKQEPWMCPDVKRVEMS